MTTKRYADGVKQHEWPPFRGRVWQRNYFEHIVRNGGELDRIRAYLAENPAHWARDRQNPSAPTPAAQIEPDETWDV